MRAKASSQEPGAAAGAAGEQRPLGPPSPGRAPSWWNTFPRREGGPPCSGLRVLTAGKSRATYQQEQLCGRYLTVMHTTHNVGFSIMTVLRGAFQGHEAYS